MEPLSIHRALHGTNTPRSLEWEEYLRAEFPLGDGRSQVELGLTELLQARASRLWDRVRGRSPSRDGPHSD